MRGGYGRQPASVVGPSCGVRVPDGTFVPAKRFGAKVVPHHSVAVADPSGKLSCVVLVYIFIICVIVMILIMLMVCFFLFVTVPRIDPSLVPDLGLHSDGLDSGKLPFVQFSLAEIDELRQMGNGSYVDFDDAM